MGRSRKRLRTDSFDDRKYTTIPVTANGRTSYPRIHLPTKDEDVARRRLGASQKGWQLCRPVEWTRGPEGVPGAVDALPDEGCHGDRAGFAPLSSASLESRAHQLFAGRLHHP